MLFARKRLLSTKISIFDRCQLVKYLSTLSRKLLALPFRFALLAFPFVVLLHLYHVILLHALPTIFPFQNY